MSQFFEIRIFIFTSVGNVFSSTRKHDPRKNLTETETSITKIQIIIK